MVYFKAVAKEGDEEFIQIGDVSGSEDGAPPLPSTPPRRAGALPAEAAVTPNRGVHPNGPAPVAAGFGNTTNSTSATLDINHFFHRPKGGIQTCKSCQ